MPPISPLPDRYEEWLAFVFDRPETEREWFFEVDDIDFKATDAELVALAAVTAVRCGSDLARYSNRQVNDGLCYIFNASCLGVAACLSSPAVPRDARLSLIRSVRHLYTDCFDHRCAAVLDHIGETSGNPLNFICYMFWDVTPIAWWEDDPDRTMFYDAIFEVLEPTLYSSNDACVEGALHGLGHIKLYTEERVPAVIVRFLERRRDLRKELIEYAQACATGHVL